MVTFYFGTTKFQTQLTFKIFIEVVSQAPLTNIPCFFKFSHHYLTYTCSNFSFLSHYDQRLSISISHFDIETKAQAQAPDEESTDSNPSSFTMASTYSISMPYQGSSYTIRQDTPVFSSYSLSNVMLFNSKVHYNVFLV